MGWNPPRHSHVVNSFKIDWYRVLRVWITVFNILPLLSFNITSIWTGTHRNEAEMIRVSWCIYSVNVAEPGLAYIPSVTVHFYTILSRFVISTESCRTSSVPRISGNLTWQNSIGMTPFDVLGLTGVVCQSCDICGWIFMTLFFKCALSLLCVTLIDLRDYIVYYRPTFVKG